MDRRVDRGDAAAAAEVQHAVGGDGGRVHVEAFGQAVFLGIVGDGVAGRVEPAQAGGRGDPDQAVRVGADRLDQARAQRALFLQALYAPLAVAVEADPVQALGGADPQGALGVEVQTADAVAAEAGLVVALQPEMAELAAHRVAHVEPAAAEEFAAPDPAGAILQHGGGAVDAAAARVGRVVRERLHRAAGDLVAQQRGARAQP